MMLWFDDGGTTPPVEPQLNLSGTAGNDHIVLQIYANGQIVASSRKFHVSKFTTIVNVTANAGDDTIIIQVESGAHGLINIDGGGGNDSIVTDTSNPDFPGGMAVEEIFGGDGNDTLLGGGIRDSIAGGAGNDFLRGGGGSDVIDGGAGSDALWGDAGNDHIYGGDNPDRIRGGKGNDVLHGGGGRDILAGEAGDDSIYGDNGADSIYPGAGANIIDARSDDYIDDGGVIKAGLGTLRLTNSSNWTGNTTVSGDILKLDKNDNKSVISSSEVVET